MLNLGDSKISALYVGTEKIKSAYVGNELVFGGSGDGGEVKPSRLPAGYTEVEYISNGKNSSTNYRPYFKMPNTTSAVKMEIKLEFGNVNTSYSYSGILGYMSSATEGYTLSVYAGDLQYLSNTVVRSLQSGVSTLTPYTIVFDYTNSRFEVNGSAVSYPTGTYWRTNSNYLFTNGRGSCIDLRIQSLKMWNANGDLVLEFVPCVNPSGIAGMYDTIGKKFYAKENSISTAYDFTPGPAV